MEKYDYLQAITEDVKNYIQEHEITPADYDGDTDKMSEELYDDLFISDQVTGNASGSYTFSTWKAEEYLAHNLDILAEALAEFGCGTDYLLEQGAEAADVSIRCYLLGQAIQCAIEELF